EQVSVSDNKSFGPEHLCLQILEKLGFPAILKDIGFEQQDIQRALISIAARAIYRQSESKTAPILAMNSSLKECLHYNHTLSHKQLYRIADLLYQNKETIDLRLYQRIKDLFS